MTNCELPVCNIDRGPGLLYVISASVTAQIGKTAHWAKEAMCVDSQAIQMPAMPWKKRWQLHCREEETAIFDEREVDWIDVDC